MTLEVRTVPSSEFAVASLDALVQAVSGFERPVVGLPTGQTPIGLFEELRRRVEVGEADVRDWRPFAIDEYGGQRDHPCSNRAFFQRYWECVPGAPPVEQFDPEGSDREAEAERLVRALQEAGGLDVALLGIGTNGHLAFNEPGSRRESSARVVVLSESSRDSARACWGSETPSWGLTLGLRELLSARIVVVLANGAHKREIVARALGGLVSEECPASLTRELPRAIWALDETAGGGLEARIGER